MQSRLSKASRRIRMSETIRIVGMLVNSWVRVSYNSLFFVTIDRNGETTVATVYEMRRRGSASSGSKQVAVIKAELRDMMGDFVAVLREVNPKPIGRLVMAAWTKLQRASVCVSRYLSTLAKASRYVQPHYQFRVGATRSVS